jgi:hypothetical protein
VGHSGVCPIQPDDSVTEGGIQGLDIRGVADHGEGLNRTFIPYLYPFIRLPGALAADFARRDQNFLAGRAAFSENFPVIPQLAKKTGPHFPYRPGVRDLDPSLVDQLFHRFIPFRHTLLL